VRQAVTAKVPGHTPWQAGLGVCRALWRSLFGSAASKQVKPGTAMPILFMSATQTALDGFWRVLSLTWTESNDQFTTRFSKYRGLKSRPPWSVLETCCWTAFVELCGLGLEQGAAASKDQKRSEGGGGAANRAANLEAFIEDVYSMRFAVDLLESSMTDTEDFMMTWLKRKVKAAQFRGASKAKRGEKKKDQQGGELSGKDLAAESFAYVWVEDAELRGVLALCSRVLDSVEGPSAHLLGYTVACQFMMAMWKGLQPLMQTLAQNYVQGLAEGHSIGQQLPPPNCPDPKDGHCSRRVGALSLSYGAPSKDCLVMIAASPPAALELVVLVQARFKGYIFRKKHMPRLKMVSQYASYAEWPAPETEADKKAEVLKQRKLKTALAAKDTRPLEEQMADFKPNVSKWIGGQTVQKDAVALAPKEEQPREVKTTKPERADAGPRLTADHKACAEFYAVYLFNMYIRHELIKMWFTLVNSYDTVMARFAVLLKKNPSVKPMVESVSAQLKRGATIGFRNAFQPPKAVGSPGAPKAETQKVKDKDLFKRPSSQEKTSRTGTPLAPVTPGTQKLGDVKPDGKKTMSEAGSNVGEEQAARDYLTQYLQEMGGDDSQFKDIDPNVVPLSSGRSPRRLRPEEILFENAGKVTSRPGSVSSMTGDLATSRSSGSEKSVAGNKKPVVDMEFCTSKLRPIWLTIKARSFLSYRSKVVQLLPQNLMSQYVEFEKKGLYGACLKLLESTEAGNLNVLTSDHSLVTSKVFLMETVYQLIVGYIGLALQKEVSVAVQLMQKTMESIHVGLRDMHTAHRTVLEAFLYDTALSVCYHVPTDPTLAAKAESYFQNASQRYLKLSHLNRYTKCCLRYASVLFSQKHHHEAEYFIQQGVNKLLSNKPSALFGLCFHNLAVQCALQNRFADAEQHVRTFQSILRYQPKLSTSWMQSFDVTQWLILKMKALYVVTPS